ncbi:MULTISPECIES: hypothetical protein [unclassified Arsukibacterium]|uniref:hypothetical protein n=1 Tax=unclassified Arsukibacterium TaxID=2635278 RepID=UPI000C692E36|nr:MULTISPECIES: hypothetical protein [unclassified Arsukibacterium]MAA94861.1 hypothetical protein [Rheinheimera sp.]MBM34664.1 hypothetical protein [Rheinheimera sp.]HAW94069.1 hypothetical protein [Candidatus Azambacteria bacterium]|tara:strand:+ start:194 stop:697 length:504 start_codon:yes stop_codon:yes gene_type:complete
MDRRQFILSGIALAAAASLGTTFSWYGWQQSLSPDTSNQDLVLSAVLPALLYGALPEDATLAAMELERTKAAVNDFLPFLPLRQQQQMFQLFNLLANRISRLGMTGHVSQLAELTLQQRLALLDSWRDSYLALLQQAYHGLRELLYGAYYGQPEHWQALAYKAPRFR